jgi:flagellar P-ring protein FlgI
MKRLIFFLLFIIGTSQSAFGTRIKDIASFDGARDNQLVGYGLVIGLNGSGDSDQAMFPVQSLVNMLDRMGVKVNRPDIKVKNVAAVMVTATLPPFAKQGSTMDVQVSSLGDSTSISGGTLLLSPLKGADGQIYAVAQGSVSTNAFSYGGQAASGTKNHPTAGRVPGGALIERELPNILADRNTLKLNLHQPDFTTATRIAKAINDRFQSSLATNNDPGAVLLVIPPEYQGRTVAFISDLERLEVTPDNPAKVVLNERTGTIVMGEKVRMSTVAVSHGNLTIFIKETPEVSQPAPFSNTGTTTTVPRTSIKINEGSGSLAVVDAGANIGDVVRGLNALGVTPRDLIGILQAIKAAGALNSELIII